MTPSTYIKGYVKGISSIFTTEHSTRVMLTRIQGHILLVWIINMDLRSKFIERDIITVAVGDKAIPWIIRYKFEH